MPTSNVTEFFNIFPKIQYDMNRGGYPVHETATDIFFRIGMIRNAVAQASSYYVYEIEDGETPEILADKFYDDAGAGWMILYANYITDAQWEWPLDYAQFQNYIAGKYGSIENAKTRVHHYEKVMTRTSTNTEDVSVTRFDIDESKPVDGRIGAPYNYYYPFTGFAKYADNSVIKADSELVTADTGIDYDWKEGAIPANGTQRSVAFNDYTVTEKLERNVVYAYDYEEALNESKREIKVIKKIYYNQIRTEFTTLVYSTRSDMLQIGQELAGSYIRRLV